jgi:hypothetical protein
MRRPERLHGAIPRARADAKSLPAVLSQSFLSLFTALLAAQFRPILRELACRCSPASALSQRASVASAIDVDGNTSCAIRRCAARPRWESTTIQTYYRRFV